MVLCIDGLMGFFCFIFCQIDCHTRQLQGACILLSACCPRAHQVQSGPPTTSTRPQVGPAAGRQEGLSQTRAPSRVSAFGGRGAGLLEVNTELSHPEHRSCHVRWEICLCHTVTARRIRCLLAETLDFFLCPPRLVLISIHPYAQVAGRAAGSLFCPCRAASPSP